MCGGNVAKRFESLDIYCSRFYDLEFNMKRGPTNMKRGLIPSHNLWSDFKISSMHEQTLFVRIAINMLACSIQKGKRFKQVRFWNSVVSANGSVSKNSWLLPPLDLL